MSEKSIKGGDRPPKTAEPNGAPTKTSPPNTAPTQTVNHSAPNPAGLTGFIPSELIVDGRPELAVFPLNIMYSNGNAFNIYEPDFSSYKCGEEKYAMAYVSKYKRNWYIIIIHDKKTGRYEGRKYHDGKEVLITYGNDWRSFFTHLTLFGLSDGE